MSETQAPALGYFVEKYAIGSPKASIAAAGVADAIDTLFEGAYMILSILGGDVKYTYTTKKDHKVEMVIRKPVELAHESN